MRVVYSERYHIAIGPHIYPTDKYARIAERLMQDRVIPEDGWLVPEPAAWTDLGLVHTATYLGKLRDGSLSTIEAARLEIPWSEAITTGFRLMTGGTVTAAREALSRGGAVHVGGGFHHAYAGHGEGFCMFNDVALAVRRLQEDGIIARAAVVDCDVHHGNGTASIFADDLRPCVHSRCIRSTTTRRTSPRARSMCRWPIGPATTSISGCSPSHCRW